MSLGCVQSEWGYELFTGDWEVTKAWSADLTYTHTDKSPLWLLCCLILAKPPSSSKTVSMVTRFLFDHRQCERPRARTITWSRWEFKGSAAFMSGPKQSVSANGSRPERETALMWLHYGPQPNLMSLILGCCGAGVSRITLNVLLLGYVCFSQIQKEKWKEQNKEE